MVRHGLKRDYGRRDCCHWFRKGVRRNRDDRDKGMQQAFGTLMAVSKVSLDIGEREVFGLVGSNGAGKSTLLRMVAGI